jgi:hypothetical protein
MTTQCTTSYKKYDCSQSYQKQKLPAHLEREWSEMSADRVARNGVRTTLLHNRGALTHAPLPQTGIFKLGNCKETIVFGKNKYFYFLHFKWVSEKARAFQKPAMLTKPTILRRTVSVDQKCGPSAYHNYAFIMNQLVYQKLICGANVSRIVPAWSWSFHPDTHVLSAFPRFMSKTSLKDLVKVYPPPILLGNTRGVAPSVVKLWKIATVYLCCVEVLLRTTGFMCILTITLIEHLKKCKQR